MNARSLPSTGCVQSRHLLEMCVCTGAQACALWMKPLLPGCPPPIQQMPHRQHRMPPDHAGAGIAHDVAYALAHCWLEAVNRARGARGFVEEERTPFDTLPGVLPQRLAVVAEVAARAVMRAAVHADHHVNGLLLAGYSPFGCRRCCHSGPTSREWEGALEGEPESGGNVGRRAGLHPVPACVRKGNRGAGLEPTPRFYD